MLRNSIKAKLLLAIMGVFVVIITLILGVAIYTITNYLETDVENRINDNLEAVNILLENYENQAIAHARNIANNPLIIEEVQKKDFQALLKTTTPLMENGKLDYMVITDPNGFVILRTHEPEKVPQADDSIANQINVAQAMSGKSFVGIEPGKVVKLSVRAGAPIYTPAGKLVGVVSTGYTVSQNRIVDMAKNMFQSEFSIFFDNHPVATTLTNTDDNTRLNTDFAAESTLNKVINDKNIMLQYDDISNSKYISGYSPVIGASDKAIAVLSCSIPTKIQEQVKMGLINKILIPSLILLIIILTLSYSISQKIVNIVTLLQDKLFQAGRGNLTVQCDITSTDEIGILKSSFNSMVEQQSEIVSYIKDACSNLSTSSHELAATSEQVTSAVSEIADNIQNVSIQSDEGSQSIAKVSDVLLEFSSLIENAKNLTVSTQENSRTALEAAALGKSIIAETKERMSVIDLKTLETEKQITVLNEYTQKIGMISDTINSLAEQTNLLSLNAAIEAARAGDAGKGFAVVAEEVRKLAEQSTSGAKEVALLVNKILESTSSVVSATLESGKEAKTGVETVNRAGESFEKILAAVDSTSKDVSRIVDITKDEMASSDKIIHLISSVANTITSTAQKAHEVAASTEEITAAIGTVNENTQNSSQLAVELQKLVDSFNIKSQLKLSDSEILQKVKTEHYLFAIRISNMLKGIENVKPEDITSYDQCHLGKWYFDANNPFKNSKEYLLLDAPHRKLHEYAYEAAAAYQKKDMKNAKKLYYKLEKYSHTVATKINRLITLSGNNQHQ